MSGSKKRSSSDKAKDKDKGEKDKFRWSYDDTMTLLGILCDIHRRNGYSATFQWPSVVLVFTQKTGKEVANISVKNKFNYMKKLWGFWSKLRFRITGAGWDEENFMVTGTDEWWESQRGEDWFQFKAKPPSREMSQLWDNLFESIVAIGNRAVASSGSQSQIVPLPIVLEEESSDESDEPLRNTTTLDGDSVTETPLGDTQETLVSEQQTPSQKTKPYTPSNASGSTKKPRTTPATKVFMSSCEMISNASKEFVTAVKGISSSSGATSRAEQNEDFKEAVGVLTDLVAKGHVAPRSNIWCYAMTELAKSDRRAIFMIIVEDKEKVACLEHEYKFMVARLPR